MAYLLRKYRSPQQIARTLKGMFPDDAQRQASHEVICNALYVMPRGSLKKELIACLSRATVNAGHAAVARIDAVRFLIWSVSTCDRLRSRVA